eukprot:Blabericola_migrator_1__7438@NODE_378_length_9209_cov_129_909101_g302_i0_p3_GENE_NODE_378_length_9209_cov_129_909101_g302_i0NODE_378_length_9209_cov_129_909101_g302_i0_p3_ORF_typecomplete_len388_score30_05_NODE_378_length_9209_cov_129_909101_g302_i012422405
MKLHLLLHLGTQALAVKISDVTPFRISDACPTPVCDSLKALAASGPTVGLNGSEYMGCYEAARGTEWCTITSHSVTVEYSPIRLMTRDPCGAHISTFSLQLYPPPNYSLMDSWSVKISYSQSDPCRLYYLHDDCTVSDTPLFASGDYEIMSASALLKEDNVLVSDDIGCRSLDEADATIYYTMLPVTLSANGVFMLDPPEGDCLLDDCYLIVGPTYSTDHIQRCYDRADCALTESFYSISYPAIMNGFIKKKEPCFNFRFCYTIDDVPTYIYDSSEIYAAWFQVKVATANGQMSGDCRLWLQSSDANVTVVHASAGDTELHVDAAALLGSSISLFSNDPACDDLVGGRVSMEVYGRLAAREARSNALRVVTFSFFGLASLLTASLLF